MSKTMLPTTFQVAGLVSEIDFKPPEIEAPSSPEPPDGFLSLLGALQFRKEEKRERAQRDALLSERVDLNERTKVFLDSQAEKQREEILAAIDDCIQRGREQQKIVDDLQAQIDGFQQDANQADAVLSRARAAYTMAEEDRKHLSRWSTRDEIKQADARIARAKAKFQEADAEKSSCMNARNDLIFRALPPEQEKLKQIGYELQRLKAIARGDSQFCDPEFGLISPAGEFPPAA